MAPMTKNETNDTHFWLRPEIDEPANVLLLESDDREDREEICQQLLTTVSCRQETVLAVGAEGREDSWLSGLKHHPSNLTIEWYSEGQQTGNRVSELRSILDKFLSSTTFGSAVVYVNALTFVFEGSCSVPAYDICQILTQKLREANAVGFVRVDPAVLDDREIESISELFDYTAELVDKSGKWRIRETR